VFHEQLQIARLEHEAIKDHIVRIHECDDMYVIERPNLVQRALTGLRSMYALRRRSSELHQKGRLASYPGVARNLNGKNARLPKTEAL
jgi:hypothetical protein